MSLDTKAEVKVGEFSRGGTSHVPTKALDHDFGAEQKVVPFGLFLPECDELHLSMVTSKVTADCMVDALEQLWSSQRSRFGSIDTLVLLMDNGPENNSRRSQFMNRLVQFSDTWQIKLRLAYYPPYHSKYNPVERCWGVLEKHWNGALLDSVEKVIGFARTMRWRGENPMVHLVSQIYEKGIKLTKEAMREVERRLERREGGIGKWFVDIIPLPKLLLSIAQHLQPSVATFMLPRLAFYRLN